jgi:hypothetical protein
MSSGVISKFKDGGVLGDAFGFGRRGITVIMLWRQRIRIYAGDLGYLFATTTAFGLSAAFRA